MSKLDRLFRTRAVTRLLPEARPFRKDPAGAKEAVLLLHGFTGIPRELSIVGDSLAEAGFACLAPRYPGHGTDRADFLATGAEDWVRRAFDSYLDLRSEYETVTCLDTRWAVSSRRLSPSRSTRRGSSSLRRPSGCQTRQAWPCRPSSRFSGLS